jgi:pimeloyl-ACP methyl ester carboxylesterase
MVTKFLNGRYGTIAYDDSGDGPLIICVPSMGDLRQEYRYLIPGLASAGYRVISMDVRGHGETSPAWPDYSVGAIGSDVLDIVRSLDAGPALVIGTSMAAGAGVWAAAEAPTLVSGLVLVGPFVRGDGDAWLKLLFSVIFARPWGPSMWLRYYATLYPSRKPDDFTWYSRTLQNNLKQPGRMEALVSMLMASKSASEERLLRVTAPTLVLMGTKDRDFKDPEAEAQWVAQSLRGTYRMIQGLGHYPHAEMPEFTASLILDFMKTLKKTEESIYAA